MTSKKEDIKTPPLFVNDSVEKFHRFENLIIKKAESETSYNNPITFYFKKNITKKALKEAKFTEWRKNIFLEFTVDNLNNLLSLKTNSISKKLDLQIKKAFKKFNLQIVQKEKFNPLYRYTIVIIQNINNKATIKCNRKAISYTPPVFNGCTKAKSYQALNRCNYLYITDYLYNHTDLSLIDDFDIENNHQIYPKLIINNKGKVIAAKIESENKNILESYYSAIVNIPDAVKPAKFNNSDEYYGYNLPTSISNIIRNNDHFKDYYSNTVIDYVNAKKMMKHYIKQLKKDILDSKKQHINYK